LYEIFAPTGAIKDKYKAYVDIKSSLIKSPQHCFVLATYPNVEQKFIQTLQNHMSTRQPLSVELVQPLISTIVHKSPQHKSNLNWF
jgi:hypothetical protein